jgi:hypothetical protein
MDPRYKTKTITNYEVPSRTDLNNILPIDLVNDIPVSQNNPESRLGTNCTLKCLKINMASTYNGSSANRWLSFYLVKKLNTENIEAPFPKLGSILESTDSQIPVTSMIQINSSSLYSVILSKTIQFTGITKGSYETISLDLQDLVSTYSNNPILSPADESLYQRPISNTLFLYATADQDAISSGVPITNTELEITYRICYNA